MIRFFAPLLLGLSLSASFASAAEVSAGAKLALDQFRATCFPEIGNMSQLREQATKAGWQTVERDADPMLKQVADAHLNKRESVVNGQEFVSQSIDNAVLTFEKNGEQLFAILNQKRVNGSDLNSCSVYSFELKDLGDKADFRIIYNSMIASYTFNAKYLGNNFAFFTSATSAKPEFASLKVDRTRFQAGMTGLVLSVGGFTQ